MTQKVCISKKVAVLSLTLSFLLCLVIIFSSISSHKITQQTKAAPHMVFNGTNAVQGAHPYMAGIFIKQPGQLPYSTTDNKTYTYDLRNNILCGGTLINKQYILTATHCLFYNTAANPDKLITYTKDTLGIMINQVNVSGSITLDSSYPQIESYFPQVEWIKSKFDRSVIVTPNDLQLIPDLEDVALIKLKYPSTVASASLPTTSTSYTAGSQITILGYGYTQNGPANQLQFLDGPIVAVGNSFINTGKSLGFFSYLFTSIFSPNSLQGVCYRDSGGPLIYMSNSTPTIIGVIVSGGKRCGGSIENSLEVKSVLPWIQANL